MYPRVQFLLAYSGQVWLNALSMAERYPKDITQQRTYRAFEALLSEEQQSGIDLVRGALLIARSEYPDLDEAHYIHELDVLARRVRELLALPAPDILPQLPSEIDLMMVLETMNRVIFEEEHFRGNQQDYRNPENSYFNKVLEKHTGIPITLALLYIEVGRRVGIQLEGIGLPWHFVVRCCLPTEIVYIDVFSCGRFLNEKACRDLIRHIARARVRMQPQWFEPVTPRQFLFRMLNNLKQIYLHEDDYARTLIICNFMVMVMPDMAVLYRDRGLVHLQLKHYGRARHNLQLYMQLEPEASDREEILKYLKSIRQMISMLN